MSAEHPSTLERIHAAARAYYRAICAYFGVSAAA